MAGRHLRPGRCRGGAGAAADAPGAVVHAVVRGRGHAGDGAARGAGRARALPAAVPGAAAAARGAADAVRAADRRGRRRVPPGARVGRTPGRARPRRHPGGDHRGAGLLQPRRRGPHRRHRLGEPRPTRRRGGRRARGLARPGVPDGHAARAGRPDRLRGQRGLPVLRDRVRRRADPRRTALRHRRDRDLPAHHPAARPAGRRCSLAAPAGRRDRAPVRRREGPRPARRGRAAPGPGPPACDDRRTGRAGDAARAAAGGGADRHPGLRVVPGRRRLGLGQLPRADHHRHRPDAGGPGDRRAGQLAAHRRRRDLDVGRAGAARVARGHPALARHRRAPDALRPRRASSCCRWGSPR